jgi:serine/threonine protein kinase
MLKTGKTIQNRYKVLKLLGQGGMSLVYLVEDNRLDHTWVLKEFIIEDFDDKNKKVLEEHFISEAKMCAKLSHPGIPKVIDYFAEGKTHYLVEEYIEGETLLNLIESKNLLKEDIIPIALQLCSVLEYLHNQGIIYRDVKPDNIMIKPDKTLKLIDFGIARIYKSGNVKDTVIVGTPGYAAPEQYGTGQTDPRSDIYSLGALMHHMVTCKDPREKPFNFDPPSSLNVAIPPYLEGIIMKSLSIKSEQRYSSIKELREALESVKKELMVNVVDVSTKLIDDESTEEIAVGDSTKTDVAVKSLNQIVQEKYNPLGLNNGKSEKEKSSSTSSPFNKIIILVYAVVFFMLFTLLFEFGFRFWLLIPYVLVAWLLVFLFYKVFFNPKAKVKLKAKIGVKK